MLRTTKESSPEDSHTEKRKVQGTMHMSDGILMNLLASHDKIEVGPDVWHKLCFVVPPLNGHRLQKAEDSFKATLKLLDQLNLKLSCQVVGL